MQNAKILHLIALLTVALPASSQAVKEQIGPAKMIFQLNTPIRGGWRKC